jgi:putative ABC transport system permease protein
MSIHSSLRSLWRNLVQRPRADHDLDVELRSYVDLLAAEYVRDGASEAEARRKALRDVGGLEAVKEEVRAVRAGAWLDRLRQDVRYAARGLTANRSFTIVAVATLALGIGANSAIFGLLDAVLLRSLPFREADRLVMIEEQRTALGSSPGTARDLGPISGHEYVAWRDGSRTFDGVTIWTGGGFNLTGRGEAEAVTALHVSSNFFTVFGVSPTIGRAFSVGEDVAGATRVAVLSQRLWQRRFASSPTAVGSTILLDDSAYTVIGVMPSLDGIDPELWVPMDVAGEAQRVGRHANFAAGRLRAGVSLEAARADLAAISRRLEHDRPDANTGHGVRITGEYEIIVGDVRRPILVAFGAVVFVLLIACANVAHLQLARAAARQREMALRGALGASRGRLIRQMITESILLSALGGGVGLLLAQWIVRALPRLVATEIPRLGAIGIDARVLVATIGFVFVTGTISGMVPAIRSSRPRLHSLLNQGARASDGGSNRLSGLFIVSEMALALVLCVGAGLMLRSFGRLTRVEPGFAAAGVVTAFIALPASRYESPNARLRASTELLSRLEQTPGVQSASAITSLPLGGCCDGYPITIEGRPAPAPGQEVNAVLSVIDDDYFRTMQIPLRAGRPFAPSDARIALPVIRYYEQQPYPARFNDPQPMPVAIISETMAKQFWPGENPVGRRFRALQSPWLTVVGVAGDVRHAALDRPYLRDFYLPLSQEPRGDLTLLLRTSSDPGSKLGAVREIIRGFDRDLPVTSLRTLDETLGLSVGRHRFNAIVLGAFGAVALLLSLIGTYGVISYGVSQRRQEIGVRAALGASARDVRALVLGRALRLSLLGIALGLAGALALTKVLGGLLFGVSPTDPLTFAAVAGLLVLVALMASWIPTRRALRVDPVEAMKNG